MRNVPRCERARARNQPRAVCRQPQGGGSRMSTIELWDVRWQMPHLSRHLENVTRFPQVLSYARQLHGPPASPAARAAACEPSDSFHTCMACRGSTLAERCEKRDPYMQSCPNGTAAATPALNRNRL